MKLNISYPATGCQKLIEIEDEKKLRPFYEKRMAQEVEADSLGDEWKGYVFRITGGNDKQGFPMKQGILSNTRVRLLLSKGHSCYRPRRNGERKRKSVRGCIVDSNLSVLSLVVRRKGEGEIEGLTDKTIPRRLGPKRASRIRKLFNLSKEDDVKQFVVRRPITPKEGTEGKVKKPKDKAPKIQRLITSQMLQHKRRKIALKKARIARKQEQQADYAKLLAQRSKEAADKKAELRKRRSTRESQSSVESAPAKKAKATETKKDAKAATPAASKGKPSAKGGKAAASAKGGKGGKDAGKKGAASATAKAATAKTAAPAKGAKEAPKKSAPAASAPAAKKDAPKKSAAAAPTKAAAPAAKKGGAKKK